MKSIFLLIALCVSATAHPVPEGPLWLTYPGGEGPGKSRHIVLIAAEQEYRSEQSMRKRLQLPSSRRETTIRL